MRNCEFCEIVEKKSVLQQGIVYVTRLISFTKGSQLVTLNKIGPYAACKKHIDEFGDVLGFTESYGKSN